MPATTLPQAYRPKGKQLHWLMRCGDSSTRTDVRASRKPNIFSLLQARAATRHAWPPAAQAASCRPLPPFCPDHVAGLGSLDARREGRRIARTQPVIRPPRWRRSATRDARSRREPALGKLFSVEYNANYSPTSCVRVPFICFCNRMPTALASALRHGVYCPLVKERG